jgi:hypothetical protein
MPLNPFFRQDTLPATSAAALREFQDRYLAALAASNPSGWAVDHGDLIPTDRSEVTFPVSQMHTFYTRTESESKFRTLREASFDIKSEEFDAGYEAKALDILQKVFAYRNWTQAPSRLVLAETQHIHNQMAIVLDGSGTRGGAVGSANDPGGVSRVCVDGVNFFASTHPINIVDGSVKRQIDGSATWSNYQSTAKNVLGSIASGNSGGTFSIDLLQNEVTSMQNAVPDENGQLLGADPDTILVPNDYFEPLRVGLANARMLEFITDGAITGDHPIGAAAVDNVYKGRFKVVPMKEVTQASGSTADWYLVDSKLLRMGIMPWVVMRQTVPSALALRVWDESSDYFKNTGRLKLSSHIWMGFGLALPHAIRRIKGPTR